MSEAFVRFHDSSDKPNESKLFYERVLGQKPSDAAGGMTMFAGEKGPFAGLGAGDADAEHRVFYDPREFGLAFGIS